MPGVSEEQVARARELDLLSYLQTYEPEELKPDGPGRFTTVTHGSLVISNGKWRWNRGQVGGVSALDYLMKVRGMGFVEAVEHLSGERAETAKAYQEESKLRPPTPKWTFYPPRPCRYATGAVSYLQSRGISPEVIRRCIRSGILYESRYYNPLSDPLHAVCGSPGRTKPGQSNLPPCADSPAISSRTRQGATNALIFISLPKIRAAATWPCLRRPLTPSPTPRSSSGAAGAGMGTVFRLAAPQTLPS